jgi:acyl-coenzyme A thioesterase PaaI-like protein
MSDLGLAVPGDVSGRALQDVIKVHCFGCGALNERGLQIKSRWDGDDLVCRWRPKPFHIGHPGVVYGGAIASVVDCHAIWAALATCCRDNGFELQDGPPPFAFVTGKLSVNYLKPAAIEHELELRARVTDRAERRYTVACRVLQQGVECANAEVLAVRVRAFG